MILFFSFPSLNSCTYTLKPNLSMKKKKNTQSNSKQKKKKNIENSKKIKKIMTPQAPCGHLKQRDSILCRTPLYRVHSTSIMLFLTSLNKLRYPPLPVSLISVINLYDTQLFSGSLCPLPNLPNPTSSWTQEKSSEKLHEHQKKKKKKRIKENT